MVFLVFPLSLFLNFCNLTEQLNTKSQLWCKETCMVGQPAQMVRGWVVLRLVCSNISWKMLLAQATDDGTRGLFSSRVRYGRCEAGCHSAQEARQGKPTSVVLDKSWMLTRWGKTDRILYVDIDVFILFTSIHFSPVLIDVFFPVKEPETTDESRMKLQIVH